MTQPDTNIRQQLLEAAEYAEEVLRTKITPNQDSIFCVTHLQAIIHRAKRAKKAGTL